MCGSTDRYVGYEKNLGLCKCKVDDLEKVCDLECRVQQRNRVTWHCPSLPLSPYIRISNRDGSVNVSPTPIFFLRLFLCLMMNKDDIPRDTPISLHMSS